MPAGLRNAHKAVDAAVEKAYAPPRPFRNDTERAEHLLQLFHSRWSQQQAAQAAVPLKRTRARSTMLRATPVPRVTPATPLVPSITP